MICYKDDWTKDIDPKSSSGQPMQATNLFRSAENNRPENGLLGVMPIAEDAVSTGAPFLDSNGPGVVGWEWDTIVNNGAGPTSEQIIQTWVTDRSMGKRVPDPYGQTAYTTSAVYGGLGSQPLFSDEPLPRQLDFVDEHRSIVEAGLAVDVALEFTVLTDGYVTNARYFVGLDEPGEPNPRIARLWRDREMIGIADFTNGVSTSRGGWVERRLRPTAPRQELVAVFAGDVLRLSVTTNKQYGYSLAALKDGPRTNDYVSVEVDSAFFTTQVGTFPDQKSQSGAYLYVDFQFLPRGVLPGHAFDRSTAIFWRHGESLIFASGCINWGAGLAQPPAGDVTKQLANASNTIIQDITSDILSQMLA